MLFRRILVWALSALLGLASTALVIQALGTTLEKFSLIDAALVALSIAGLAFIWLDYCLKTEYLRS